MTHIEIKQKSILQIIFNKDSSLSNISILKFKILSDLYKCCSLQTVMSYIDFVQK